MRNTRAASRYAKSLLELAIERKELDAVYADIKLIADTCNASKELILMLDSPIIKSDKKQAVLKQLFASKIGETVLAFIGILTNKKREFLIDDIAKAFVLQYNIHQNICSAKIISAVPLTDKARKNILDAIQAIQIDKKVELVEEVNKDIIGGIIVRVGDRQVDASIQRKLIELKKNFSKNEYIADF